MGIGKSMWLYSVLLVAIMSRGPDGIVWPRCVLGEVRRPGSIHAFHGVHCGLLQRTAGSMRDPCYGGPGRNTHWFGYWISSSGSWSSPSITERPTMFLP